MEKEGNKEKVVLTGTYESSYGKFRHMRANRSDNKKINLNIIKLFFKKIKKQGYSSVGQSNCLTCNRSGVRFPLGVQNADMVELVDPPDLESGAERRVSSSLAIRTKVKLIIILLK